MDANLDAIAAVLIKTEHVHAAAFESVNGEDPDWAVFYANWLIDHSSLLSMVTSASLTATLAELDERYVAEKPDETWEHYYARGLVESFVTMDTRTR